MNTPHDTGERDDEMPRDEHLRAALRHAPDAGLAAPADIGAQIRAAAWRAAADAAATAARPIPTSRLPGWPQRVWAWFGKPGRLGASGAFATLLIGGVIGLAWRGEMPAPQVDEAPAAAAVPARSTVPLNADAASAATGRMVAAEKSEAAARTAPTATAPVVADKRSARPAERTTPSPAPVAAAAAPAAPAAPAAATSAQSSAALPAAAPAIAPPPATESPVAVSPAPAPEPAAVAAPAGPARALSERSAMRNRAESSDASSDSPRPLAKAAAAAPVSDFAAWLDHALARGDGDALLVELAGATRGRWLAAAAPPTGLPALALPRSGPQPAVVSLADDAVWGCLSTPSPRCQRAPLTAEQAARLRELIAAQRR